MNLSRFVIGGRTALLLAFLVVTVLIVSTGVNAQQDPTKPETTAPIAPSPPALSASSRISSGPASGANWHAFDSTYYKRKWGVEIIGVRRVSSGAMLRFNYRVLDAERATTLNDKRWNPFLVDEATGAKLGIPEMEKVGKLRQSSPPENGHIYWMVFGNPNQLVKAGNRVDVVIGSFRAEGIVVE
jgi:hypothetical protein